MPQQLNRGCFFHILSPQAYGVAFFLSPRLLLSRSSRSPRWRYFAQSGKVTKTLFCPSWRAAVAVNFSAVSFAFAVTLSHSLTLNKNDLTPYGKIYITTALFQSKTHGQFYFKVTCTSPSANFVMYPELRYCLIFSSAFYLPWNPTFADRSSVLLETSVLQGSTVRLSLSF